MTSFGPVDGCVLDTDGVITRTADVHERAWAQLFDGFMSERADQFAGTATGRPFTREDYLSHVDGRPRYDGVAAFLSSRGISLPVGSPEDGPDVATVCGLGNRKNAVFRERLAADGVRTYATTVDLVKEMRAARIGVAAVSASENQLTVLAAAGVTDLFDVRVDGVMARELGLAGKPDPALFLEAARRLDVEPARAVVVEDARSGVEAGRRGGFGWVVGVDRADNATALAAAGADVVTSDLGDLSVGPDRRLHIEEVA